MDRLKLGQLGERLKTGGAQMGRLVSGKFKEMLQTPTPESKMVDEATLETLEEPNWGMNLRICALINSEEFSGSEIVRAIKKKISGKSPVSQKLSLDLLEACAMNCEKVFSEVASEKVLDEMVRMIDNPQTDPQNRDRALQLIRAWGESEDLAYMPVFQQTYMNLRTRSVPLPPTEDGNSPDVPPYSWESYIHQPPLIPENYPVPQGGLHGVDGTGIPYNYGSLSIEEKKELLVVTRNSLELLSSILNTDAEPVPIKEYLTSSLLEKCKESQPVVLRIVETTTDDEAMLFEALNLHEELQQVVRRYEELEKALNSGGQHSENSDNTEANSLVDSGSRNETKVAEFHDKAKIDNSLGGDATESSSSLIDSGNRNEDKVVEFHDKAKVENSLGGDATESSSGKSNVDQVAQVGLL